MNGKQKAQELIGMAREKARTDLTLPKLDDIVLASTYSEPGYGNPRSGVIAIGDWRPAAKNDPIMPMLAGFLVQEGIDIASADEWTRCDQCGGLVRTEPDAKEWVRSYQDTDNGRLCLKCIHENAEGKK